MNTVPAQKKSRLPVILFIITVIVVGYYVLFGQGGITQKIAEQKVAEFASTFNNSFKAKGEDGTFTYGAIHVERDGVKQRVVVTNPTVTFKEPNKTSSITSDLLFIYPDNVKFTGFEIVFPNALKISPGELENSELIPSKPVTVNISTQKGLISAFDIKLPDALTFKHYIGQPSPQTLTSEYAVTMANPAEFSGQVNEQGALIAAKLLLKDFTSTDIRQNKKGITAKELSFDLNNKDLGDNKTRLTYKVTMNTLELPEELPIKGPFTFEADLNMEGQLAALPSESPQASPQGEIKLELNTLKFASAGYSITANASLLTTSAEALPTGEGNIIFTHPAVLINDLIKTEVLEETQRPLIDHILTKITGRPLAENDPLNISIKRSATDQAVRIGNTTFDEVVALVMQSMMNGAASKTLSAPQQSLPPYSGGVITAPPVAKIPAPDADAQP